MQVTPATIFPLDHVLGMGADEEVPFPAVFCSDAEWVIA